MNTIHYYLHNGSKQEGPYTLEEMLQKPLKSNTPIWKEGQPNWQEARTFPEFNQYLQTSTPPPYMPHIPPPTYTPKKKNGIGYWVVMVLALILIACFAGALIKDNFFDPKVYKSENQTTQSNKKIKSYNLNDEDFIRGGARGADVDEQQLLRDVEIQDPSKFLEANCTYYHTLFGQNIRVNGKITNKAIFTNYKDISVQVTYYSATNTIIDTETFVLYDYVPAKSSKSFTWKIKRPRGTDKINWKVSYAVPYSDVKIVF